MGCAFRERRVVADGWTSGGLVLEVCGIDGRGDPYYDEVLVFRVGSRLISIGTVYWPPEIFKEFTFWAVTRDHRKSRTLTKARRS